VIRTINDALLELQGALLARSLYPAGHPRIRDTERRAVARLADVLEQIPEIALFCLDGRVIFQGQTLPSCTSLSDTLFRMLKAHGVDQITFRRGLQDSEIRRLLDHLASGEGEGHEPMRASTHIGFSSLRSTSLIEHGLPPETRSSAVVYAEEAAHALPGIWQDLNEFYTDETRHDRPHKEAPPDLSRLERAVSCVSRVVCKTSDAMVPLAPLKKHDEYTFVHTINVAILSTALAEALALDDRTVQDVNVAALLHDVGKQRIPASVLNKRGRFDDDERALMQTHPVEGARILLAMPGVPDLAPIVAYEHHIRADGSGYPKVPPGWKLNLASRIVQLADVFDALRTDRPYRRGLPVPKIAEMMRNDVGTFFDADLLDVFFQSVVSRRIPDTPAGPAAAEPDPLETLEQEIPSPT